MSHMRSRVRRLCAGAGLVAALAGLGVATAAPAGAAVLLSNGSFETPVVPGHLQRFPVGQSIAGWTVTTGDVDLTTPLLWQAADGNQSLDLDGGVNGGVSQTLDTILLLTYRVSYALAGNYVAAPAVKTGKVLVNGTVVQNFSFDTTGKSSSNMGYVRKKFTFLATGLSTTLEFRSTTTPAGWGPVIDDVQVESCLIIICPS